MKKNTKIFHAFSFFLILIFVGCEKNVVDPINGPVNEENIASLSDVTSKATIDLAPGTLNLPGQLDVYEGVRDINLSISYIGGDGNDVVLAFYNPEEGILSVHTTSDAFACSTPLKIKPLADRLVTEPVEVNHLNHNGTVFTKVYSSVTPTVLEDFLADVCLFLDTATPVAQGRIFWAYDYSSYNQSTKATTPYTLRVTGILLDASEDRFHLHLVRQYLIPPSGDPASEHGWLVKWVGPTLKRAGNGGI